VIATVSLSSQVLGKGRFASGSFGKQNGYSNKGTVELIGMISAAQRSRSALTRQTDGPVGDFSQSVAGDSTAGDWGSDTHGRGGNLYLPGNGEANEPHVGFGCHANKFITFDVKAIRAKHFGGKSGHFSVTGFVGVNGAPSVPPVAAIQAGVWVDGKRRNISRHIKRDDRPHTFKVYVSDKSRYLTLAMLNGPQSTHFDDIAFRDVNLSLLTGDIPIEVEEVEEVVAETQMNEEVAAALPRAISIPYPLADRGLLYGQYGGFLGAEFDPAFVRPGRGNLWKGISPNSGRVDLRLSQGMTRSRFTKRRTLLNALEQNPPYGYGGDVDAKREQAMNMLMSPAVRAAFDVRQESSKTRQAYGDHICGQSALMARRLVESGVPLVTVNCSVGDLNGARGDNWDTHGNNFNRLKNDMLPPLDRTASALLTDLQQRGRMDDVLVVILTEFGRTPRINKAAGRDHFPNCYSVAFAGGGIRGGQVYGSSNKTGSAPAEDPCGPNDLHATIFHALGIHPRFEVHDLDDRPFPLTDGKPLPIFG